MKATRPASDPKPKPPPTPRRLGKVLMEHAAYVERLRDENARLRLALREFVRTARGIARDGATPNWLGDLADNAVAGADALGEKADVAAGPTVLEQVREAYADCVAQRERDVGMNDESYSRRQLDFRATAPLPGGSPDLAEALRAIGGYNGFDPDATAEALSAVPCEVTVAREGSVCLYVRAAGGASPLAVENALLRLGADEVDDQGDGEIRAWWD